MSRTSRTARIRQADLETARTIATRALGRTPTNDSETLATVIAASCDEAIERLTDLLAARTRANTVATSIHIAGAISPHTRTLYDMRTGWTLVPPDGERLDLGHANVGLVVAALARRGVTLDDAIPIDD